MEGLKTKRKGLRTSFTVCANALKEELPKEALDWKTISVCEHWLQDKSDRLAACQEEISNKMLQLEDPDEAYMEDSKAAEGYRDRYFAVVAESDNKYGDVVLQKDSTETRKLKLPKIELKKFSCDAKEFLSFCSMFEKIHLDAGLPAEDKFQNLLEVMLPGSK
ncbi:hypothetical protein AVEN_71405-1 [Araneus ventricosus]|uniref:Uncharacterized protein n=1 Tax=Araneus ventricosus TaxID=182803 RepID=A0A4Y2BHP8_ARAVE|nr:hypothetical protein AVEN_71405-1 [Araneus ventricosus]